MRRRRVVPVEFSKRELVHLRRFLNRAVDCCEGRCPEYTVYAWYYAKPLLKRIDEALTRLKAQHSEE